jgi:hypothetical protein
MALVLTPREAAMNSLPFGFVGLSGMGVAPGLVVAWLLRVRRGGTFFGLGFGISLLLIRVARRGRPMTTTEDSCH